VANLFRALIRIEKDQDAQAHGQAAGDVYFMTAQQGRVR
jgi:hypothetical protein